MGLRPGGVRRVTQGLREKTRALRLRRRQLEMLLDTALTQIGLRQHQQAMAQPRRGHHLHHVLRAVLAPRDAPAAGLTLLRLLRALIKLGEGLAQIVQLGLVQRRRRQRGSGLDGGGRTGRGARIVRIGKGVLGAGGGSSAVTLGLGRARQLRKQGRHRIQVEGVVGVGDDVVNVLPGRQRLADRLLLLLARVQTHERGGVAQGPVRLILLLHQAREHPDVAGEARVRRAQQQGRDLR